MIGLHAEENLFPFGVGPLFVMFSIIKEYLGVRWISYSLFVLLENCAFECITNLDSQYDVYWHNNGMMQSLGN